MYHFSKIFLIGIVKNLGISREMAEFNFRIRFTLIVDQEVFFGYVFCPMVNLVGIKSDLGKLSCVRFRLK